MKALLVLILFPLAGAVRTEFLLVESHISNKNIPLFTLENEEQKILCLGIFLADHQILFRATCIPKLPRKLKGLYARAYSGMRYSAVSLWVRRGYTGVGEDENEYAILYLHINPTLFIVKANIAESVPTGKWGAAVYGKNKDGENQNYYKQFHSISGGYIVSESVLGREKVIDGVMFRNQQVIGFAKNIYETNVTHDPNTLLFTVLNSQFTYQNVKNNPILLEKSTTYLRTTKKFEMEQDERNERSTQDCINIERLDINFRNKDDAIIFVEHKENKEICVGVLIDLKKVFVRKDCAAKLHYDANKGTVSYIFFRRNISKIYPHPEFSEYYVLQLQGPLPGNNNFMEIAENVSPESISDGGAIGYNLDWEYHVDYVAFQSYNGPYLFTAHMRKKSDVIVDGVLIRNAKLIGFFEENSHDSNIMVVRIISPSTCTSQGLITAPLTALPERENTSQFDSDEEE